MAVKAGAWTPETPCPVSPTEAPPNCPVGGAEESRNRVRQKRYRDRVHLGLHVTRPLAVPDIELAFALIEAGYLTDAEVENGERIDAALEKWITKLVTP